MRRPKTLAEARARTVEVSPGKKRALKQQRRMIQRPPKPRVIKHTLKADVMKIVIMCRQLGDTGPLLESAARVEWRRSWWLAERRRNRFQGTYAEDSKHALVPLKR